MKRWFILAAGIITLSGTAVWGQDPKLVAQGQKLYDELKCGTCHMVGGKGGKMASSLDGVGDKMGAADLKLWLTDPAGMTAKLKTKPKVAMKPVTRPDADLNALVAYMQTLKKK